MLSSGYKEEKLIPSMLKARSKCWWKSVDRSCSNYV